MKLSRMIVALCLASGAAMGASLHTEEFGDGHGWIDRSGPVSDPWVVQPGASGYNSSDSLLGTFGAVGFPSSAADAWRAGAGASGGAFTGNYWADAAGFTAFRFRFYADDVLPSDLSIRFTGGGYTYLASLGSQVTVIDNWLLVQAPLDYAFGWSGTGGLANFSNALANVTAVDVQVRRSGMGSQGYGLDAFELTSDPVNFLVPEPSTSGMMLAVFALFTLTRKRRKSYPKHAPRA